MTSIATQRELAERLFMPVVCSEGASSVTIPAATKQMREKTARLKALRLERDMNEVHTDAAKR